MVLLCMIVLHTSPVLGSRRLLQTQQQDTGDGPALAGLAVDPAVVFSGSWPDTLVSGYLSNEQLEQWSADYVRRCSKIARRFSIGKSVMGVDLWVMEIAANPGQVEAKPNFKYVSAAGQPSGLAADFCMQHPPGPAHSSATLAPLKQPPRPVSAAAYFSFLLPADRLPTCMEMSRGAGCCSPCWQSGCAAGRRQTRAQHAS
jgi:hypothetical protein